MEDGFFSHQLRGRLSQLRFDRGPINYRNLVQSSSSLQDITATLLGCQDRSRDGGVASLYRSSYSALLARKTILKHLQLFCSSEEINRDISYAYGECKSICLAVNNFNMLHCSLNEQKNLLYCRRSQSFIKDSMLNVITYSDIMDVCIEARARSVTHQLIKDCSVGNMLRVAEFEDSFIMSFVGVVATFTGTLSKEGLKKAVPSEDQLGFYCAPLSESTNVRWKNYLITGHQAVSLKSLWKSAFCKLWNKVAGDLSCWASSGQSSGEFLSNLSQSTHHKGLELHPEVASCLRHVSSLVSLGKSLEEWDSELQQMLRSCLIMYRKGYRKLKVPCQEISTFLRCCVFEELNEAYGDVIDELHMTLDKASSMLLHVEIMKQATMLCAFLRTLIHHITLTLLFALARNMHQWNLPNLAWFIMIGLPTLQDNIKMSVTTIQYIACPRISFPVPSNFHNIASQNRGICSDMHHNVEYLQDLFNHFYTLFQESWQKRCSILIPSAKKLKKAMKQRKRDNPSKHCIAFTIELFIPMLEGALTLPEESQQMKFIYILLTIFYDVLRKSIISNKDLLVPCIADNLLQDLSYLQDWLVSEDRSLSSGTYQLIRNLPIVLEIERGLQRVSGKPYEDTDGPALEINQLNTAQIHQKFPILSAIAWNSDKDWNKA